MNVTCGARTQFNFAVWSVKGAYPPYRVGLPLEWLTLFAVSGSRGAPVTGLSISVGQVRVRG